MGADALTTAIASTSRWNAADYASVGSFVAELGAGALDLLDPSVPIVIDPVMVAESGATLLDDGARAALRELLIPRATVITPNLPEARVLAGKNTDDAEDLARQLHRLGPHAVVVTGGNAGIGRATALEFARLGARVVVSGAVSPRASGWSPRSRTPAARRSSSWPTSRASAA